MTSSTSEVHLSVSQACARWAALEDEDITVEDVRNLLEAVPDDLWVATACLDRVVDNVEVQRALLTLGVSRTDAVEERFQASLAFAKEDVDVEDKEEVVDAEPVQDEGTQLRSQGIEGHFRTFPEDAKLCLIRALFLRRLDLVNTYEELQGLLSSPKVEPNIEEDLLDDDPWADVGAEDALETEPATDIPSLQLPLTLSQFLRSSPCLMAFALASHLQFNCISSLLRRHKDDIFPYRFHILDHTPRFAEPQEFRDILPAVDPTTSLEVVPESKPWREVQDWSEDLELQDSAKANVPDSASWFEDGQDILEDMTPQPDLLPEADIITWYKDRVIPLATAPQLIDNALSLLQHGVSQGVSGLDDLGEDISLISHYAYDVRLLKMNKIVSLQEWRAMEPAEVVKSYLAGSTPEEVVSDIRRLVLPYLSVLESRHERSGHPDPELSKRLLYDYLLKAPLSLAGPIFEASKPTFPSSERLIKNDEDLVRLALASLYGSGSVNEWSTMNRIFECMPAWSFEEEEDDGEEADATIQALGNFLLPTTARPQCTPSDLLIFFQPLPIRSLSRALDILDVHLESGEILAKWDVPAPLRWFLHSHKDEAQQRTRATQMARRSSSDLQTEDGWRLLLDDMIKVASSEDGSEYCAFAALSQDNVTRIFFSGLLNSGSFSVARTLLDQGTIQLDGDVLEELCLNCSREFYDNADSGNYNFGNMKLAYECLDVPPSSPRVQREKEFVEATSRISSYNVMSRPGAPLTPIMIRLTKDKLTLVSRVLSSNETAYRHTEVILDLMRKLGYHGDLVAEVKTLAMMADTALQSEDFAHAVVLVDQMVKTVKEMEQSSVLGGENARVQEAKEVCWVTCFQLGRHPEFQDQQKKLALLACVLEICPADNMLEILSVWQKQETEYLQEYQDEMAGSQDATSTAKHPATIRSTAASLTSRLQAIRVHSPNLAAGREAAAMASEAFSRVTANFPFSIHGHANEGHSREVSPPKVGSPDIQATARHALQKGLGWLIGDDD